MVTALWRAVTSTRLWIYWGRSSTCTYSYDFAGNVTQRELLTPGGGRELYYYDSGGARYMTVSFDDVADAVPSRIRVWIGGAEIWYEPGVGQMDVAKEFGHLSLGALNVGRVKKETTGATTVTTAEGSFHNGLSHLMGAVDWDSGVVTAAFVYGPFGEVVASVGAEEDEHLRRFNGKEADLESGLSYYGFRYYDSKSLSWTQADPLYLFAPDIGFDQPRLMTLYAFSLNNPIRYVDPDGLEPSKSMCAPGMPCPPKKGTKRGSDGADEEEETGGRDGESGKEDGEDKDRRSSEDGTSEGEKELVEVVIFDGLGGFFPAITIKVEPDTAKAIDGAGIVALVISGAAGLVRKFARKFGRKAAKRGGRFGRSTMGAAEAPLPKFTRAMKSNARSIAEGKRIDKVDTLVEKFGGKVKGWRKMSTQAGDGTEIHWYEHHGIGKVGVKRKGFPDPF